jgi:hypothetical protein
MSICKRAHQSSDTASNQSLHPRFLSPSIQNEQATSLKDGTLPQTNTSSLIEPLDNLISTSFSNHKNALQRVTNYNQEQPIDIDPNTILQNSLITTNYILKKIKS